MALIIEVIPEKLLQDMPVSAEDWAQTPKSVQALVTGLVTHFQGLEVEVAHLRMQINRNSSNSSQPPSSDGPDVVKPETKKKHSGLNRGGQTGHPGTNRKLVPVEELKYYMTPGDFFSVLETNQVQRAVLGV